jgi:peptide/nickel transport system substrate-binding protein
VSGMTSFWRNQALSVLPSATTLSLSASLCHPTKSNPAVEYVLRVVPRANLTSLDPGWMSIYIIRNHGCLIYDALFALDSSGQPRPEMVEAWTESPDRTFKLRDGLKWHDSQDVAAEDCVASLKRWAERDRAGQELFDVVVDLSAADSKTMVMKMEESRESTALVQVAQAYVRLVD